MTQRSFYLIKYPFSFLFILKTHRVSICSWFIGFLTNSYTFIRFISCSSYMPSCFQLCLWLVKMTSVYVKVVGMSFSFTTNWVYLEASCNFIGSLWKIKDAENISFFWRIFFMFISIEVSGGCLLDVYQRWSFTSGKSLHHECSVRFWVTNREC